MKKSCRPPGRMAFGRRRKQCVERAAERSLSPGAVSDAILRKKAPAPLTELGRDPGWDRAPGSFRDHFRVLFA
jgi:hypothetical protein